MKIAIASDHRGYKLKNKIIKYLEKNKHQIEDYGTDSDEVVDYVDYSTLLCNDVLQKEFDYGILICGTGIGMSIAANKIKGIYCAKINNEKDAYYAKRHNDANVISISASTPLYIVKDMLDIFMKTNYQDEERYTNRINKIKKLENCSKK